MKTRNMIFLSPLIWLAFSVPATALTPAFHIFINGEESNTVTVEAAPNTFAVRVAVMDEDTGTILPANTSFVLEVFQADLSGPGLGSLQIYFGQTINGEYLFDDQYSKAENIRIRVRDAGGSGFPLPAYSTELQVHPSAPANSLMWADPPAQNWMGFIYYIPSNAAALVKVGIYDANNNPLAGLPVSFSILPAGTSTTLTAAGSNTTDALGMAAVLLQAGSISESFDVQAAAGALTPSLHMGVVLPTATPTVTLTCTHTPVVTATPTFSATPTASRTLTWTATAPTQATGAGVRAYPNPARDTVNFAVRLEQAGEASVRIYNFSGEPMAEVKADLLAGPGVLAWECRAVAPGVYLAVIRYGSVEQKLKIAVVK